ncbi:MAG: MFS transporter [Gammaproteobacteria bacterium]|nr:MFS transporter [Gammaproteobacteria bacterium]
MNSNRPAPANPKFFHGWWLVGVGFLLQGVVVGIVSYSYGIVLTPIAGEFSASRFEMMLGVTACTLVAGVSSPFFGVAMDRYPLRRIASVGVLLLGSGLLLLSVVQTLWQVTLVYALFMGPAMVLMGTLLVGVLLARWFSRRRGTAMGVAALGTSACGLVLPPLLQYGIDMEGWRTMLQLLGIGVLGVLLPLAWLLVADHPHLRGLAPDGATGTLPSPQTGAVPSGSSTREIFAQRNFWMIAAVCGVLFSVYASLLSNLVPFATGLGFGGEQAALLISVIAMFGMLGKLLFGVIADRIELRLGLGAAIVLLLLGLAIYGVGNSYLHLLVASVFVGIAAGGMLPVWGSLMAVLFGTANYGRAMGLMSPVMMPLVVFGSPFAGWIFDVTGDYTLAFTVFGVALLVALLALAQLRLPGATGR